MRNKMWEDMINLTLYELEMTFASIKDNEIIMRGTDKAKLPSM